MKELIKDEVYMREAIKEAANAARSGEVPVGAVIVRNGEIIARAHNTRETEKNALYHAETLCINSACKKLHGWRLPGCTLYVTLEPCAMCAGAIINSRIERLVYGAPDPKAGSVCSVVRLFDLPYNWKPEVASGVLADECANLLGDFFRNLRGKA
ncbi:MAG: tRNA adenosine(34) deaminase TadA [Clostridia bacterium]|nr:tRNA adenosine(34) deaminase TadA [Clostridia bacterium]